MHSLVRGHLPCIQPLCFTYCQPRQLQLIRFAALKSSSKSGVECIGTMIKYNLGRREAPAVTGRTCDSVTSTGLNNHVIRLSMGQIQCV
jgi:hypothetical protein